MSQKSVRDYITQNFTLLAEGYFLEEGKKQENRRN
jgi:hypothetical protein